MYVSTCTHVCFLSLFDSVTRMWLCWSTTFMKFWSNELTQPLFLAWYLLLYQALLLNLWACRRRQTNQLWLSSSYGGKTHTYVGFASFSFCPQNTLTKLWLSHSNGGRHLWKVPYSGTMRNLVLWKQATQYLHIYTYMSV